MKIKCTPFGDSGVEVGRMAMMAWLYRSGGDGRGGDEVMMTRMLVELRWGCGVGMVAWCSVEDGGGAKLVT
ncbi:hypothetical protein Tco_1268037 [Tanacetum coccineum]